MSHAPGAYLGGIRTVHDLMLRCRVDKDTGCWHWRLSCVQGAPKVHFVTPDTGRRVGFRGRRAALYLAAGVDLRPGHVAFAKMKCTSLDCVNPEHCRSGTRIQQGEHIRRTGIHMGLPAKAAASRRGWDGRRKITPEMAAEIRSSQEPQLPLARRLGVSEYAVWCCRVGKTHRPDIRGASAFTWAIGA